MVIVHCLHNLLVIERETQRKRKLTKLCRTDGRIFFYVGKYRLFEEWKKEGRKEHDKYEQIRRRRCVVEKEERKKGVQIMVRR